MMIHNSMRLIARGLAAGRLQTLASGLEHIPSEGPVLIVARHYHHFYDGLALFAALQRPFHIIVALDWVENRPTRYFMETLTRIARWPVLLRGDSPALGGNTNAGPFSRHDVSRYRRKAVRESVDLLVEGEMVVIFPEGYPSIDPHYTPKTEVDDFLPFKPGFITIVAAAEKRLQQEIPIIPVGVRYTPGKPWVVRLNFGTPTYRKTFNDTGELIAHLDTSVRRLSGVSLAGSHA